MKQSIRGISLFLLLGLLVGCAAEAEQANPRDETPMAHIHSLAISPSDEVAFVATHSGLYQVALDGSGQMQPMPVVTFDAMALTVVAETATLITSGHSPAGTNLGLMSSTNGGSTWATLPGTEGLDFHVLAATPEAIYGTTSELNWSSTDGGASWTRAPSIDAADYAITGNGATLFATTAEGLQMSQDAGRTFASVDGAPELFLVESDRSQAGALVGIAIDGTLWRLDPANDLWSDLGAIVGAPEGLAVTTTGEIVIADERGIQVTKDGSNWTTLWTRT